MIRQALCGAAVALTIAGCGGGGGGGSSADDTSSDSYQNGFKTGQGMTLNELVVNGQAPESACDQMFTSESIAFNYDKDQFMRGCLAGQKQAHP
ncbi:MAG: hypothetical protein QOJ80_5296 [Mycobacterium sp.]|nr:hypothetical protein [Mycobacterium sp.]